MGEFRRTAYHISPDSLELRQLQEEDREKKKTAKQAHIFGGAQVEAIKLWKKDNPLGRASIYRWAREAAQQLKELHLSPSTLGNNFFSNIAPRLQNNSADLFNQLPRTIQQKIKIAFEKQPSEGAQLLAEAFQYSEMPDSFFAVCLDVHVEKMTQEKEKFEKKLPELQRRTRLGIEKLLEKKGLSIPSERIERIFSETNVVFTDPLLSIHFVASYFSQDQEIHINYQPGESDEAYHCNLTHEYLHALSGRTLVKQSVAADQDPRFRLQRLGLSFYKYGEEEPESSDEMYKNVSRFFVWLDEAVTERLAREATGVPFKESSYRIEEHILEKWFAEAGIPLELVYEAYFEDYDPTVPAEKRIPAWKKLLQQIKEVYKRAPAPFLQWMEKNVNQSVQKNCVDFDHEEGNTSTVIAQTA